MKRRIFSIFLINIVGLFLFSIHDKAGAENWKTFSKDFDEDLVRDYDKDSIHYPYDTKGFLGSITTDKNIVRVWIKLTRKSLAKTILLLEQVWCSQREIQEIEGQYFGQAGPVDESIRRIIPGSWQEKLYNEVCK